jgi:hypothetical protein
MAVTGSNQGIYALGLNAAMDSTINKNRYLYVPGANGLPSTSSKFGRIRDVCATPYGSVFFIARDRNYPRIMEIYNPLFASVNTSTQVDNPLVFPNPCVSGSTVFIKQLNSVDLEFEVLDAMGKIVISGTGTNNQLQFDTKGLKSGVYFIRTADLRTKKLIVSD